MRRIIRDLRYKFRSVTLSNSVGYQKFTVLIFGGLESNFLLFGILFFSWFDGILFPSSGWLIDIVFYVWFAILAVFQRDAFIFRFDFLDLNVNIVDREMNISLWGMHRTRSPYVSSKRGKYEAYFFSVI